jgi:uncharacterized protein (DUF302 family)
VPNASVLPTAKEDKVNRVSAYGIVQLVSPHSVDETLAKLKLLLDQKGITLFAIVDHSGEAAKVGLSMPPTKLAIFGSPKAGTPVMIVSPSAAIDLPLKILVSENKDREVVVSYNAFEYLEHRHGIPHQLVESLAAVKHLAEAATK